MHILEKQKGNTTSLSSRAPSFILKKEKRDE